MERRLRGGRVFVRQQHQHARRRNASVGIPVGADADDQLLRQQEQPDEGSEREHHRRRHPRGPDRGHQRQDSASRSSKARPRPSWETPRSRGSSRPSSTTSSARISRRTRRSRGESSARPRMPPARVKRRARPATSSAGRARSTAVRSQASWPTARSEIRRCASSTSSRESRRAGPPNRVATGDSRPSCP